MMKKSYILIILISFLVISPKLYAQVECPCDFESVPKTTECWVEPFTISPNPTYTERTQPPSSETSCNVNNNDPINNTLLYVSEEDGTPEAPRCQVVGTPDACGPITFFIENNLTPEQLKACQCELLAYTTALNEVAGILVSGGPPYECGNVDCRELVLTPIPTLNEWGMITTAGVLGLLAVIGLFVIRRKKVSA